MGRGSPVLIKGRACLCRGAARCGCGSQAAPFLVLDATDPWGWAGEDVERVCLCTVFLAEGSGPRRPCLEWVVYDLGWCVLG